MGTDGPVAAYGCGVPLSENNDILSVTNSVIQRNLASSCPTEYPVVTRVGGGEEGAHDCAHDGAHFVLCRGTSQVLKTKICVLSNNRYSYYQIMV